MLGTVPKVAIGIIAAIALAILLGITNTDPRWTAPEAANRTSKGNQLLHDHPAESRDASIWANTPKPMQPAQDHHAVLEYPPITTFISSVNNKSSSQGQPSQNRPSANSEALPKLIRKNGGLPKKEATNAMRAADQAANPYHYYGNDYLEKFSKKSFSRKKPVPSLISEPATSYDIEPFRIAIWDNAPAKQSRHGFVTSYIASHFLKRVSGHQFHALFFVIAMYTQAHDMSMPPLFLNIDYLGTSFEKQACILEKYVETGSVYTGARDIQAHCCIVPSALGLRLASQEVGQLQVSVSAQGHKEIVNLTLKEWDPVRGHSKPQHVYNYTSVTMLKPNFSRCIENQCDPSVIDRLPEFIAHHVLLGFDHIYLYCADEWHAVQQRLTPFIEMDRVTVIAAYDLSIPPLGHQDNAQVIAFSSHLERYREYSNYVFIQDVDEMLYIFPNLNLSSNESEKYPPSVGSKVAQYVYMMERRSSNYYGYEFCAVSITWFTIIPDDPNVTSISVLKSYHTSLFKAPSRSSLMGKKKSLTRSKHSSAYANQHTASFKHNSTCVRATANSREAAVLHFRIRDREHHIPLRMYIHKQNFTIPLYHGVSKLLKDLGIWK